MNSLNDFNLNGYISVDSINTLKKEQKGQKRMQGHGNTYISRNKYGKVSKRKEYNIQTKPWWLSGLMDQSMLKDEDSNPGTSILKFGFFRLVAFGQE